MFIAMLCCFLISAIGGVLFPDPQMRFSLFSILEIILIYALLIPEPADGFDSSYVLPIVAFYIRLIAICGIVQYALQFAHFRLFSFSQLSPHLGSFLTESGYHTVAVIKYGSPIFRSNGLFLLEPSLLSQVIVLGIVIDFFVLHRKLFLPVYAVALLVSYSGTGILALAITLIISGLLSPKQLRQTGLLVIVGAVIACAFAIAFPAEFATLTSRASGGDPSSKLRYASQLDILATILNNPRVVIGFGPGAAEAYINSGSMSPALKLFFDYGLIGLLAFIGFIFKALWRSDQRILSIMCLVIFQVGGGILIFSPWIFLFAIVCIWSKPVSPIASPPLNGAVAPGYRRKVLDA
jgi:uncharacterized membrane protein